ncbi:hypothetical protein BpHYR1_027540 [Brachionus plicatilis]|uniref:Uncharacterized protein n=1 Tax=Brachionus plicatilis TaxID=10195 RepID=A0A3M7SP56_BRAPC|nr:hypothetical protein BpHYR1_027540 [Brachionus plicatilis]
MQNSFNYFPNKFIQIIILKNYQHSPNASILLPRDKKNNFAKRENGTKEISELIFYSKFEKLEKICLYLNKTIFNNLINFYSYKATNRSIPYEIWV